MKWVILLAFCGSTLEAAAQHGPDPGERSAPLRIGVRLFLEGPYNGSTGMMHDSLRVLGLVPVHEPYEELGYVHVGGGGGEETSAAILNISGSDAVVDWVVLELRDAAFNGFRVDTRSALLQRDGDVVDVDGNAGVAFSVAPGTYFFSVKHRNHLGVMTSTAITFDGSTSMIDFTLATTAAFGTAARKSIGGVQVLWAGDATGNGQIKYVGAANDRDPILLAVGSTTPNNSITDYLRVDVNMDGKVKYTGANNDRDPILINVGSTTPNNVRTGQVP